MKIHVRFHVPKFTKKALAEFLKTSHRELETNLGYLLWTLEPEIYHSSIGLFLEKSNGSVKKADYSKLIKTYGRFNAEGLVNHIHLNHIIRNQVWQFEIGIRAIKSWGSQLKSSGVNCNTVIYLNESYETSRRANYTICLYSDLNRENLQALESRWKREVKVLPFKKFIKWARKEYPKLVS